MTRKFVRALEQYEDERKKADKARVENQRS